MMKELKNPIYVAFRIGAFYAFSKGNNIVTEHNRIVESHGSVFLGKAGRIFPSGKMELIQDMILRNGKSRLYLIQKQATSFAIYISDILNIITTTPNPEKIPSYYRDKAANEMTMWFEIGQFTSCGNNEIEKLRLLSSGRPLIDVLNECRTTLMLVTE